MTSLGESTSLPDPAQQYSPALFRGFYWYLVKYIRRHFNEVLVSLDGLPRAPADRPLVICSNHPSWWDPLIFVLLNQAFFPLRRGYGPMEAEALERYSILKRLGIFAIDLRSPRGGVAFLIQAKHILDERSNALWLAAEGNFKDVRKRPLELRPGLGHLVRMVPEVVVLPLALEYPFWNESRPVALCRFGDAIEIENAGSQHSASEWNECFEEALCRTMDRLSKQSMQRDAVDFQSLLHGQSGVGGIYDGWRRLRARMRGRRFDPSHGQLK